MINFGQLDGKIIAPTSYKDWGKGLLWWIEFSKLSGITIQGKGVIDGRGSVWWQGSPYDDPFDDETKLIIPLNSTVNERTPMPVTINSSHNFFKFNMQYVQQLIIISH